MAHDDIELSPGDRLRAAITDAGYSINGFAKRYAGPGATPAQQRSALRSLRRWLAGTQPESENAARLAKLLKKPAGYFDPPDMPPSRIVVAFEDMLRILRSGEDGLTPEDPRVEAVAEVLREVAAAATRVADELEADSTTRQESKRGHD